jgi:hypothetical protein
MDQHQRIACILSCFDLDWPFPGVLHRIQHNEGQLQEYPHQFKCLLPCRLSPLGAEKFWPGERGPRGSAAEDHGSFALFADLSYLFMLEGSFWWELHHSLQSLFLARVHRNRKHWLGCLSARKEHEGDMNHDPLPQCCKNHATTLCQLWWQRNSSSSTIFWSSQRWILSSCIWKWKWYWEWLEGSSSSNSPTTPHRNQHYTSTPHFQLLCTSCSGNTKKIKIQWTTKRIQWCLQWQPSKSMGVCVLTWSLGREGRFQY